MDDRAKDSDLLARLNALKPSTVHFNKATDLVDKPHAVESRQIESKTGDDLTARFAALSGVSKDEGLAREEIAAHPELLEPDLDVNFDFPGDETAIDDLLADLELSDVKGAAGEQDWKDATKQTGNARDLLKEARLALRKPSIDDEENSDLTRERESLDHGAATGEDAREIRNPNAAIEGETPAPNDEVDELVRAAVEDVANEAPANEHEADSVIAEGKDCEPSEEPSLADLGLPAAPTDLPTIGGDDEDTDYTLPAAPTYKPRDDFEQTDSGDDVETWCIVCLEDATLRCVDCDGDLFCDRCFAEFHHCESAGSEERNHKAILYEKTKKEQKVKSKKRKVKVGAG